MSQNLTGIWVGEYRYPKHAGAPAVSFTAQISDIEHEPGDFFMMREKPEADELEVEREAEIV